MTKPDRVELLPLAVVGAGVVLVSCVFAFVGLDASGLWTDELFSAYFSDPSIPTAGGLVQRASEDVNPPAYYLLLWAVRRSTDLEFEVLGRGLSALLGCLAILVVTLAPTRSVTLAPRLAAGAFAAGSAVWFLMTQEARAYALVFVLAGGMSAMALRSMEALRRGDLPTRPLAALAALSVVASLTHYYALLLAGGVFTMLLVHVRSVRALLAVGSAGLSVLACAVAFVLWHRTQIVADVSDTWFSADPDWLLAVARQGVRVLIGSRWSTLFLCVLGFLLVLGMVARGSPGTRQVLARGHLGASLPFLAGAFCLTFLYGVAVTTLYTPMLSHRVFYILAPVLWIALAHAIQLLLALGEDSAARTRLSALLLSLALLPLALQAFDRGRDAKQPWRHTAEAVAALQCAGAVLPVGWFEKPYISEDDPERFYGYYLPQAPGREWHPVDRSALLAGLGSDDMGRIVQRTAEGSRACPLLLWLVHIGEGTPTSEIVAALAAHLDPDSGADIEAVSIRPADGRSVGRLFLLRGDADRG